MTRAVSAMNLMKSKEEVVQEFRIQSIQDATMRVISRKGMAAATMQEIYLYFRDRDELVEKTFETAMQTLLSRIDAALALDIPIEEKLRAIMTAKFSFFETNREFFRLYLSLRMPEGPAARQRRQKQHCQPQYKDRTKRLAAVLTEAMERGEIRRTDAYKLALFISEGSTAIILDTLTEGTGSSEQPDVEIITSLILDGIRKRS
jgi:AcrR family transcriptional regulator